MPLLPALVAALVAVVAMLLTVGLLLLALALVLLMLMPMPIPHLLPLHPRPQCYAPSLAATSLQHAEAR